MVPCCFEDEDDGGRGIPFRLRLDLVLFADLTDFRLRLLPLGIIIVVVVVNPDASVLAISIVLLVLPDTGEECAESGKPACIVDTEVVVAATFILLTALPLLRMAAGPPPPPSTTSLIGDARQLEEEMVVNWVFVSCGNCFWVKGRCNRVLLATPLGRGGGGLDERGSCCVEFVPELRSGGPELEQGSVQSVEEWQRGSPLADSSKLLVVTEEACFLPCCCC